MKQVMVHKIDLLELEGKGDFLCHRCKAKISPDDETENVYSVLEAIVRNDRLENVLVQCNNCSSKILLTGFQLLKKVEGKS